MPRLLTLTLLAALSGFIPSLAAATTKRPNVVLIVTDDQGTLDLGCYGAPDLKTPNLDNLAKRGIKMTQFYVAAPVCSPSRASILTGRNHNRAGVPGNVSSKAGHPGMPTEEITLAEHLGKAGYRTALFGKWHLGTIPECDPLGQGFHEFVGHKAGCIDNYSHYFYWSGPHFHDLWRNRSEIWEDGEHFGNIVVREAQRFISENKHQPYFLFLPLNLPHYPTQSPLRFRRLFKDLEEPRRSYAATLAFVDDCLGRILDTIKRQGQERETLVVFLSDHGHSTEERTGFGGGYAGIYRGAKFSLFEGGIRVPCLLSFPGKLPQGVVRDQFTTSVDLFPTILELCQIQTPNVFLDGQSIVRVLLENRPSPHTEFNWKLGNQSAIRSGKWKLIMNPRDTDRTLLKGQDAEFLVDLSLDPGETKNLAKQNPHLLARLKQAHLQWQMGL